MSLETGTNRGSEAQAGTSVDSGWFTTVSDRLAQLFYPTYKQYLEGTTFAQNVERSLEQANYNLTVEIYLSRGLGFASILSVGVIAVLTVLLATAGFLTSGFPEISPQLLPYSQSLVTEIVAGLLTQATYIIYPLIFSASVGLVVGVVAFGFYVYLPRAESRRRSREIDILLNHSIAFMYSLSVGGTNRIQVIQAIADAEDTYGEVSVAFQRIAYEMSYFNTDYQTAIENVANITPNEDLEAFLTDLLSVINSGGDMTSFLETQHEMMRENSQKKQEEMLDTLEIFGEMYLSLNILPLGLMIVLVIVSMIGSTEIVPLFLTVFVIIPGLNLVFAVMISTFKQDEPSDGKIDPDGRAAALNTDKTQFRDLVVVDYYNNISSSGIFSSIRRQELQYRIRSALQKPWEFLRLRPLYTLVITVPVTLAIIGAAITAGVVEFTTAGFIADAYTQTVIWVYIPVIMNAGPVAFFYEWNYRIRGKITDSLTQDIRKLSNANETGQPVLESIRIAATGDDTLLSKEFRSLYKKAKFGTSLSPALVEFNNRYQLPRLTRVIKLIQKAQESSSNITDVLSKAAITSQYQDRLLKERKQRSRMQVAITGITFLVFLGVLIMLDVYFLGEMFANSENGGGDTLNSGLNLDLLSMLFLHAVTIQAIFAGMISGFIQTGRIESGLKYATGYLLVTGIVWGLMAA